MSVETRKPIGQDAGPSGIFTIFSDGTRERAGYLNEWQEICETEPAIERNVVSLKKKSSGSPAVDKAIEIVYGERNDAYGPPEDDFLRIGRCWGAAIATWLDDDGIGDIPPDVVAMMMIQLKTIRAIFKPSFDSHVDIVGYAVCSERCHDGFEDDAA